MLLRYGPLILIIAFFILKYSAEIKGSIEKLRPKEVKAIQQSTKTVKDKSLCMTCNGLPQELFDFDFTRESEGLYELDYNKPLVTKGYKNGTEYELVRTKIDNRRIFNSDITWSDNQFQYEPKDKSGNTIWLPGRHAALIEIRDSKGNSGNVNPIFWVQWRIGSNDPQAKDVIPDPRIPKEDIHTINQQGQVLGVIYGDATTGELVMEPFAYDQSNPIWVVSKPIVSVEKGKKLDPDYNIILHYRITKSRRGNGFQVRLPGMLTLQIGDGNLNEFTLKWGGKYFDRSGTPRFINKMEKGVGRYFRRQAPPIGTTDVVSITMSKGRLTVACGQPAEKVLDYAIPQNCRKVYNNTRFSLRTYGSHVRFSCITVRPPDWPEDLL